MSGAKLRRAGGFTLIEMLVVIGIILIMLALAAAHFGAFAGRQKLQLGVGRLSAAMRAARQMAITSQIQTLVELVDVDAAPTYSQATEGDVDKVRLWKYQHFEDFTGVGAQCWVIPEGGAPEEVFELPSPLRFLLTPGPMDILYGLDTNGDGVIDDTSDYPGDDAKKKRAIRFDSSGGATSEPTPVVGGKPNLIQIEDPASKKTALLYVYPLTGYIKEVYP